MQRFTCPHQRFIIEFNIFLVCHVYLLSRVVFGPERMIIIPPRNYCVIENPVLRDKDGEVLVDAAGQVRLSHADLDIRLAQDPFPLYPGEILKDPITPLTVVVANSALRLMAILDFEDDTGDKRTAGDEWLFNVAEL